MQLENLLEAASEEGASDIILSAGARPQMRVNGILVSMRDEVMHADTVQKVAESIISKTQLAELKEKRRLEFSYDARDLSRFRVSMYYQRGSVAVAIRRIPNDIPSFEELGLPDIITDFSNEPHGLVLITGPAGSGKSTTLAAMIDYINATRFMHVICIEDPIEYVHVNRLSVIDQREIGSDAPSFNDALRSVFRQSPDVIMIGEMRDLETMQLCLTLAETGHLILATLHTQDATHSINRLVDSFPPDQQKQVYVQLSMVLRGVISQRLVLTSDSTRRVLAYEVMRVTNAISNLIREMTIEQIYSVIQTSASQGMCSMNDSLARLYRKSLIDKEVALKLSPRVNELERQLERNI